MYNTTLILGGCRSGKSSHALFLAENKSPRTKLFLATCVPQDTEMEERVQRHKAERGPHWRTVEEPLQIDRVITENTPNYDVIIVDCLTLWVTNMILAHDTDEPILQRVDMLCNTIASSRCPLIFVSNEVGMGIVPGDPLSRRFRDLTGWTNQRIATACDQVILMVAGIALMVKPQPKIQTGP